MTRQPDTRAPLLLAAIALGLMLVPSAPQHAQGGQSTPRTTPASPRYRTALVAGIQKTAVVQSAAIAAGVYLLARPTLGPRVAAFPLQEKCLSTVYGMPGDKWAGSGTACSGRPIGPTTIGIAHRWLPCGTPVVLRSPRTGRAIVVPVIDRGPYGALLEDGTWVVKKTRDDPGTWRGCADLTPFTALLLGHRGFEPVHLSYERPRRPVI